MAGISFTRTAWKGAMAAAAVLGLAACASAPPPRGAPPQTAPGPLAEPGETTMFGLDSALRLCPGLNPSNAPATDANGYVVSYAPLIQAGSVALALNPAPGSCLTSGFGPRRGRLHKGLDLQSQPPGPIVAAADGRVLEAGWRDDYGRYVVLEHGGGVYTLYAHLARLSDPIAPGALVRFGQVLGMMGGSGSPPVPVHLHYEVLLGDYREPEGVFGLFPVDPFRFPPAGER